MADSIRLAVLKQLTTYLATEISIANDYSHDMTREGVEHVWRGRFYTGPKMSLPAISILEGVNPDREPDTVGNQHDMQKDSWILLVQGWVDDDNENPTDPAHALLADVKMAMSKYAQKMVNLEFAGTPWTNVVQIIIEPGVVRPPDQISDKAYFWMRIVLQITEPTDDPFWRA